MVVAKPVESVPKEYATILLGAVSKNVFQIA
jgi:hypothetical protein